LPVRELAASGTDANPDFRDKKLLRTAWKALRGGDPKLTDWLIKKCPDVINTEKPSELIDRMNDLTGGADIHRDGMLADIRAYDTNIARGKKLHNDDQIRRLQQLRQWTPDRVRTCNMQPIIDPKAGPLIAIRESPDCRAPAWHLRRLGRSRRAAGADRTGRTPGFPSRHHTARPECLPRRPRPAHWHGHGQLRRAGRHQCLCQDRLPAGHRHPFRGNTHR